MQHRPIATALRWIVIAIVLAILARCGVELFLEQSPSKPVSEDRLASGQAEKTTAESTQEFIELDGSEEQTIETQASEKTDLDEQTDVNNRSGQPAIAKPKFTADPQSTSSRLQTVPKSANQSDEVPHHSDENTSAQEVVPATSDSSTVSNELDNDKQTIEHTDSNIGDPLITPNLLPSVEPSTTEDEAPPYQDQYLDAEPWLDDRYPVAGESPTGRRVSEVEFVYYDAEDDFLGSETEKGVRGLLAQETLHFGDLAFSFEFSDFDSNFLNYRSGSDALLSLRQIAMPLAMNSWLDNTLGHQRTSTDNFLHGGYRFRLPTSPLLGYSGRVYNPDQSFHWSIGRSGSYQGIALKQFNDEGGTLASLGYKRNLNSNWSVGTELTTLNDHDLVSDHTSLLGAVEYTGDDNRTSHEIHVLADDDSHLGVWTDSAYQFDTGPTLRYGTFYFDDELQWSDTAVADDQLGAYVRIDRNSPRYNYSLGYEYYETGLEDDALLSSDNHSLFLTGTYRLNKKTSAGFSAVLFDRDFEFSDTSSTLNDHQTNWRLSSYLYKNYFSGTARAEIFAGERSSDIPANERSNLGARLSYDWKLPERHRLTTEISTEQEDFAADEIRRDQVSVLYRQDLNEELSVGATGAYFNSDSESFSSTTGTSLNVDARWQFHPEWFASLTINKNETAISSGDTGLGDVVGGNALIADDRIVVNR